MQNVSKEQIVDVFLQNVNNCNVITIINVTKHNCNLSSYLLTVFTNQQTKREVTDKISLSTVSEPSFPC